MTPPATRLDLLVGDAEIANLLGDQPELAAMLEFESALAAAQAEVALMAQNEAGTVRLAAGGTSTAMPHKSNLVTAEILVALARFNAGLFGTFHQSLLHENERSGAAWTLEWMVLPQMAITTGAALRHAQTLISKDSSSLSFRAWRITSTGRGGAARSFASNFGASFNSGSAAHAAIHARNASRSAARSFAVTAFVAFAAPPISMS